MNAEWYYVGTFGQLGPLTLDQMRELASDGVINRDTYVWRTGMSNWMYAEHVSELLSSLGNAAMMAAPPPPPTPNTPVTPAAQRYGVTPSIPQSSAPYGSTLPAPTFFDQGYYPVLPTSDKSRIAAGVLQFIIPGVGRMYLGYWAQGIIQLITVPICGLGAIWSYVDGVLMLCGSTKVDGYGRSLRD
jgi:TM2 domain-containing membrane protein YozV